MKMKKYEVSDMKEALKLIREDLGPDAVILSTRKVMKNNNFGLFARAVLEVTAAIDYQKPQQRPVQPKRPAPQIDLSSDDDNGYATYQPSFIPKTRPEPQKKPKPAPETMRRREPEPAEDEQYESEFDRPYKKEYVELASSDDDYEYIETARHTAQSKNRPVFEPTANNFAKLQAAAKAQNAQKTQNIQQQQDKPRDNSLEQVAAIISSLGLDKFSALLSDVGDIKKQLGEMKSSRTDNMVIDLSSRLKDYHTIFTKNGMDDVLSYRFLKNIEKQIADNLSNIQVKSAITDMLSELIIIEPDYSKVLASRIIALAGPTGVGKTTTIAKIAANMALKYRKKVCLITVDNFRIGAVEQLKTYAEIVNIPLYVATSPDELKRIIREVRNQYDCILLDSMGRSQFDVSQIESINSFLHADDAISVALVLSLASNHAELYDTLERYSALSPDYLIFTKLDETRYFGPLINLPVKKRIPLLLVTTGQNVPDDMEVPDGKKIARRILQEIPTLWSDK